MTALPHLPWDLEWRPLAIGVLVVCLSGMVLFCTLRLRASYHNELAVAILQQQLSDETKERLALRREFQQALAELTVTVYGPITTTPRKPSAVELWQRNRDKELRDRIHRLEQWRYRLDSAP